MDTDLPTSCELAAVSAEPGLLDVAAGLMAMAGMHNWAASGSPGSRSAPFALTQEARYRALVEQIPAVVFLAQMDGGVGEAYVSPQVETILGFTQEEWLCDPVLWFRQLHPDDRDRWSVEAADLILGNPLKSTYRVLARDGSTVWFRCEAKMVRRENGDPWFIHGAGFDITEMKHAEELLGKAHRELESRVEERTRQLARANAELACAVQEAQNATKAKSAFLATMSHEIRTPMNGVLGMIQVLLGTPLSGAQRETAVIIKESADSLLTIINDILDFSKIEAGMLELETIGFRMSDVVNGVIRLLSQEARKAGLELLVKHPVPDIAVMGDPARLRQILLNLVGNAIKFTEKGRVVVSVTPEDCRAVQDEKKWRFSIADTGIGIPVAKQKTIFHAFTQADGSTSRQFGGTGLGLTISARLVEMMSGRIWVESEEGRGSTFYFTAAFPQAPNSLAGVNVIALAGSAERFWALQDALVRLEMVPTVLQDPNLVLARLEKAGIEGSPTPIAVLGFDVMGPDAVRLLGRIRAVSDTIRIVALTPDCDTCDPAACGAAGVDAFLRWPIDDAYLERVLRNLVDGTAVPRPTCEQPQAEEGLITAIPCKPWGASLRILLVEDNRVNQRVAETILTRSGHHVTIAGNGEEGVRRSGGEIFDVVLMDVQMPVMDGLEATAAIRNRERETGGRLPIIAMTAHALPEDVVLCMAAGMDGYVSKPFRVDDLLRELGRVQNARTVPPDKPNPVPAA